MVGLLSVLFFASLAVIPISLIILIIRTIRKKRIKANVVALIGTVVVALGCFVLVGLLGCKHQWEKAGETPPTCTEDGYAVYQCSLCGQDKREVLKTTGHTMIEEYRKEPTALEDGEIVEICSVCGYKHITPVERKANGGIVPGTSSEMAPEDENILPDSPETPDTTSNNPDEKAVSESPTETIGESEIVLTGEGFTVFAYPLDGDKENLIFTDERFDILNLFLESETTSNPYSCELTFRGILQNHSGRDWEAVGLRFCLLDKDKNPITDIDAGFASIGNSVNYLTEGEEREFTFTLDVTKYVYNHAEWIALSGLTSFG